MLNTLLEGGRRRLNKSGVQSRTTAICSTQDAFRLLLANQMLAMFNLDPLCESLVYHAPNIAYGSYSYGTNVDRITVECNPERSCSYVRKIIPCGASNGHFFANNSRLVWPPKIDTRRNRCGPVGRREHARNPFEE